MAVASALYALLMGYILSGLDVFNLSPHRRHRHQMCMSTLTAGFTHQAGRGRYIHELEFEAVYPHCPLTCYGCRIALSRRPWTLKIEHYLQSDSRYSLRCETFLSLVSALFESGTTNAVPELDAGNLSKSVPLRASARSSMAGTSVPRNVPETSQKRGWFPDAWRYPSYCSP